MVRPAATKKSATTWIDLRVAGRLPRLSTWGVRRLARYAGEQVQYHGLPGTLEPQVAPIPV